MEVEVELELEMEWDLVKNYVRELGVGDGARAAPTLPPLCPPPHFCLPISMDPEVWPENPKAQKWTLASFAHMFKPLTIESSTLRLIWSGQNVVLGHLRTQRYL